MNVDNRQTTRKEQHEWGTAQFLFAGWDVGRVAEIINKEDAVS
jgi:hypothetical protein